MAATVSGSLAGALLLLVTASAAGAQTPAATVTDEVPLTTTTLPSRAEVGEVAALILSGRDALAHGLTSVAARLFGQAWSSLPEDAEAREALRLPYATALVGDGRYREALALLPGADAVDDPRVALRLAQARVGLGNLRQAAEVLDTIEADALPPGDQPWYALTRGLIASRQGRTEEASEAFREARELAPPSLVTAFALTIERERLLRGNADEDTVAVLRSRLRDLQGQRGGFQAARLLVVALQQMGQRDEALALLDEQLRFLPLEEHELRNDFLVLLGLIAGPDSGRGALALQELLRRTGSRETRLIALYALASEAFARPERSGFVALLDELLTTPAAQDLRDELLYLRARLALEAGDYDIAEEMATALRDEFPGSTRLAEAVRLLALTAWQRTPPHYRTAASRLLELRGLQDDPASRTRWTLYAADCYFLNGDYGPAATTYAQALREADPGTRAVIVYQQVLAELVANGWEAAAAALDAALEQPLDPAYWWRAEWNLLMAMTRDGALDTAFARVARLTSRAPELPPTMRLRFLWLRAHLAFRNQQLDAAIAAADAVLATLERAEELPALATTTAESLRSAALLLKGEALLERDGLDGAATTFARLREAYGQSMAAQHSYLLEARYYASEGQLVDAQQRLLALVEQNPTGEVAPVALWEAAEIVAQRGDRRYFREAIGLLERLVATYPEHPLVFHARLRQGDLSRLLNDFATAELLYTDLLNNFPNHPEWARAEISRADARLAQAADNPGRREEAQAAYERLADIGTLPLDLRLEAAFKSAFALEQLRDTERAVDSYWLLIGRFLTEPNPPLNLGVRGEYWMARAILRLAELLERLDRPDEAVDVYALLTQYGLPGQSPRTPPGEPLSRLTPPES